jgi:hypothetical protein
VIGDPVEGRGRQDGVHGLVDRERGHQVGEHEPDPIAERREPAPRGLEHRRRAVERDHGAVGESFGEERGHSPRTAPGVQDGLVAVELEPVDHGRTPSELRIGDRVVGLGVPVARHAGTLPLRERVVDGGPRRDVARSSRPRPSSSSLSYLG